MGGFEKILVPLDGSKTSEAILPSVEKLATALKTMICLLRVVHMDTVLSSLSTAAYDITKADLETTAIRDAEEYLRGIEERLKANGLKVESHVRVGDEAEEILEFCSQKSISFIAMSTHGRTGVERLLVGTVTGKVIRQAGKPVFLVRSTG